MTRVVRRIAATPRKILLMRKTVAIIAPAEPCHSAGNLAGVASRFAHLEDAARRAVCGARKACAAQHARGGCRIVRGRLDGRDELVDFAELREARHVGVQGEEGVIGAEQHVARSDGHADELVRVAA